MNKIVVLSLAVLSMGGLRAEDDMQASATPTPAAEATPTPLPPLDQSGRPDRGPHGKWKQNRPGMPDDWRAKMRNHAGPHAGPGPDGQEFGQGVMLAKTLNLTKEQQLKAKAIMAAAKPKLEAVREEGRAKAREVIQDAIAQLRPLLTPEQQAVLDDMQKLRADKAKLDAASKNKNPNKPEKSKENKQSN